MDQSHFVIYPAVDLLNGRAVRLRQGRREDITDCGDPVELASIWRSQGAKWLHVVDLEAAFEGHSRQGEIIRRMADAFQGLLQLGGGIRTMDDMKLRFHEWGVSRLILGTAAVTQPHLVLEACVQYPGKIACGIDAKDGLVAVRGWVDVSGIAAMDLAKDMEGSGVAAVIYTDISRDGMMSGPNVEATKRLSEQVSIPVIASGGIASLMDLKNLKGAGCAGAIVGKALYSKAFTLNEALQI